jgi:hypothetical protein
MPIRAGGSLVFAQRRSNLSPTRPWRYCCGREREGGSCSHHERIPRRHIVSVAPTCREETTRRQRPSADGDESAHFTAAMANRRRSRFANPLGDSPSCSTQGVSTSSVCPFLRNSLKQLLPTHHLAIRDTLDTPRVRRGADAHPTLPLIPTQYFKVPHPAPRFSLSLALRIPLPPERVHHPKACRTRDTNGGR